MKKYHSFIIAIAVVLVAFTSCDKEKGKKYPEYPEIMQMITDKSGDVTIWLAGSEPATIDWGDGSAKVTKELSSYPYYIAFTHRYTTSNTHIIKISGNHVTYLGCSHNQLLSLNVRNNTELIYLQCQINQIMYLDVSNNSELVELFCDINWLTDLDVSKNTALIDLSCSSNLLASLDVSNIATLRELNCSNNEIMNLDVSANTMLTSLGCTSNRLTNLDVSDNTALTNVYCQSNRLSAFALDTLFSSLHNNIITGILIPGETTAVPIPKTIYIGGNPGTASCTPGIATENGWTVNNVTSQE